MLIRRNTKTFKTIMEIVTACQSRADREKLIRLYITKAGHSINDRISVEGIQGEADVLYNMNYQAVLNNLKSSGHQLHHSDEIPGIYFFHSSLNKAWDETPFEFDEAIRKEFAPLPELPMVRKKEKPQKFVFPSPRVKTESEPVKKEKVKASKNIQTPKEGPKQPGYKLRHKIEFTDLEKIVFRQARLTKKDVLDYYHQIAEYMLPYLKDRPQLIRLHSDHGRPTGHLYSESLIPQVVEELPDWVETVPVTEGKERKHLLRCNDREHLLFYAGLGCLQFNPCHSRVRSLDSPDYIVIGIDSADDSFAKVTDTALAAREILTGLQLPSFIKTDGISGLHIYIPLDSKSTFETGKNAAGYICNLIRLKIPDLVTMNGPDGYSYGKVSLDYLVNEERNHVVAPYSIVPGQSAIIATPLLWEEVKEGLRVDDFTHETIFKRLKQVGDPFANLFRKKVNAGALLERLEANYSFLF
jgi:DNA ligase D-like protein (predicted polymerase)